MWQKNGNTANKVCFFLAFKQSVWPFYSLFLALFGFLLKFSSGNPGSRRTSAGLETRNRRDIRAEPHLVSAVVTCAVPRLNVFHSLVVSIWQHWVCAIRGAHLLGSPARIQRDIRADCFSSCKLRCCRTDCVLLLGLNVQSDIFAVMIAWS